VHSIFASIEAVCLKTLQQVNRDPSVESASRKFPLKNYMSYKIDRCLEQVVEMTEAYWLKKRLCQMDPGGVSVHAHRHTAVGTSGLP
jgi:hypothetical protein